MKENKVYVVTSGDYSDYEIDSIFSSREKAEEYINHSTNMGLNGIDEWVLDEKKPDKREKIFSVISDFDEIDFHVSGRYYDTPALKAHSFRGGMKTQTDASRYAI